MGTTFQSMEADIDTKSSNSPREALVNGRSTISSTDILSAAFVRFKENALASKFVPWKFHPREATFEPAPNSYKQYIEYITIEETIGFPAKGPGAVDESYSLTVSANGSVTIIVASASGGIYALDTLAQLFYTYSGPSGGIYTQFAPLAIQDSPAFEHRGLNLDISRNWISPMDAKHTIDGMSFNKFNRLHLHATDAQSWPIEVPALPDLTAKGAYKPGLFWSVAELKAVQTYATYRGIDTFLEIDSPGHTASIAYAYPDLIVAFNEHDWSTYAAEPPSGQVKLSSSAVLNFFDTLYSDLLPRVSPFSNYFHSGGDEINAKVYALDPGITSSSPQTIQPYLQTFISHLHGLIRSHSLTPIVWEETLLVWNTSLPTNDTVIQTWLGQDSLISALKAGYKAIFGDYTHWYLDCGYGQWLDPNTTNAQTPIAPPYADYCSPLKNWRQIYSYDPLANVTASEQKLILGGEVHIWGELTDPVNLDSKVWPRAAAAAEVLWSGVKGPRGVNEGVTRRLAEMRERMVERGFEASMVQMTWCLQNRGGCSL